MTPLWKCISMKCIKCQLFIFYPQHDFVKEEQICLTLAALFMLSWMFVDVYSFLFRMLSTILILKLLFTQGKTSEILLEYGENTPLIHVMPGKSTIEVNVKY